ncbi:toxic anion resistance protein, partial [Bacillus pumilus]|uniref:toxic anion resistance protein n=1 Tax=Bacillus pumilus TaxID=1408 RepID=UPI00164314AB
QQPNQQHYLHTLNQRNYHFLLTPQIPFQSNPQIPIIHHTNHTFPNHIQSTLSPSIPLSINQISIPLTHIHHPPNSPLDNQVQKTYQNLSNQQAHILQHPSLPPIHTFKNLQPQLAQTLHQT